jgi:ribonuclease-3
VISSFIFRLENLKQKVWVFFRKEREPYFFLYKLLGFYPRRIHFYKVALLHKSQSVTDASGDKVNNERLEFLGDSILGSIVSVYLYRRYRHADEGFLTVARSRVVCRKSLNEVGFALGLHDLVKNSITSSSHNTYLCGNALEALVGAIYLDRGYRCCQHFVEKRILEGYWDLDKLLEQRRNFKSDLLEWAQKHHISVEFELVEEKVDASGSPVFCSDVYLDGQFYARGEGYTKKDSHQEAARQVWERLQNQDVQDEKACL